MNSPPPPSLSRMPSGHPPLPPPPVLTLVDHSRGFVDLCRSYCIGNLPRLSLPHRPWLCRLRGVRPPQTLLLVLRHPNPNRHLSCAPQAPDQEKQSQPGSEAQDQERGGLPLPALPPRLRQGRGLQETVARHPLVHSGGDDEGRERLWLCCGFQERQEEVQFPGDALAESRHPSCSSRHRQGSVFGIGFHSFGVWGGRGGE